MIETANPAKTLTGVVVSNKMEKTISVQIKRTVKHDLYGKYHIRTTRLMAHDENNECNEGDTVIIESFRPLSKNKAWRLQKVIAKSQEI